MSKLVKAVIFDMDGVILDSEESIREAEVQTFKKFGIPAAVELMAEYTGMRFEEEVTDISKRFGVKIDLKRAREIQDQSMEYYYKKVVPPVPYIQETLEKLSQKYLLGLATMKNKKIASLGLKRLKLSSFFKAFTFASDVALGKPDPQAFLRTAKLLGVEHKNCMVVEDSNPGVKAGKAAGMLVIAKRGDHNENIDLSLADFIVEDVREIPKILDKLSN